MPRLWLTYAWKDNEAEQVDLVVQELQNAGVEVAYDRVQLVAGQRLWPQLDAAIRDPRTAGWALYATANNLRSEACQEELAYALDRALRTRGGTFPLIGIFPEPMDPAIVPSAIQTRLHVSLLDPGWATRVAKGLVGEAAPPASAARHNAYLHAHMDNGRLVLEVRPLAGRWHPFVFMLRNSEREMLSSLGYGPSGRVPWANLVLGSQQVEGSGGYSGIQIENPVDAMNSAYAWFRSGANPTEVAFGQRGAELIRAQRPLS